jgi:NAD kinase
MELDKLDKIIVVTKKTVLEELLLKHATTSQARFYIESRGKNFDDYLTSHQAYKNTVEETLRRLPREYRKQIIERTLLSTHQFDEHDIVVVVGDPGLFVNVAKYTGEQPIISINGEPNKYDDIFTSCKPEQIGKIIYKVSERNIGIEQLTMAEAVLDDGQKMLALNDLFIGKRTQVSARYILSQDDISESQSSSGVVVSTGTGSTAWMKAILAGAYGIVRSGVKVKDGVGTFERGSDYLRYFVREPFPTKVTGCEMITGYIDARHPLNIISNMSEDGVIFSDGVEQDYISFDAGTNVIIKPADTKVQLVR